MKGVCVWGGGEGGGGGTEGGTHGGTEGRRKGRRKGGGRVWGCEQGGREQEPLLVTRIDSDNSRERGLWLE
jgi:hypothetical protein